ncbi:MAG TPA: formimidoylglutamate deiminase [Thermoanaerobaculia bacterium]|nr:formimidoylglutamate deiminase [Thermoanaerobaculia bacterium]
MEILAPDLVWSGATFIPGLGVWVDDGGRIAQVRALAEANGADARVRRLPDVALLPGFVNAHSHAFQRGLRGRGERFPQGAGSFWSWREAMYGLVEGLTPDRLFDVSRQAFLEMRRAGITCVGEFHYLHHPGAGDYLGDEAVLSAAREIGIRIVLLQAYYRTGSIGGALQDAQLRFETPTLPEYWKQMEHLAGLLDTRTQSLGVVAHSIRAVPLPELRGLYAEARRQALPFHMHVEEQRQEIEECRAAYGKRPMELLLQQAGGLEGFTAVHCTHTRAAHLVQLAEMGGRACICPLTEANLGDGIPSLAAAPQILDRLCLGTDSNARISMLEEMRWLEYGQRLKSGSRGALREEGGSVATVLLRAATLGGGRALGVLCGQIDVGYWADLVAIDLKAPPLAGCDRDELPEALISGGDEELVTGTFVGGRFQPGRSALGNPGGGFT